jgi:tRNA(Ile)-lysidine synthase TilS/MesJ
MDKKINKIVLAYSGGLDTSAMLLWLKETYGCEVICYCADVGQGDELSGLEEKAKKTGASKLYVEDLREEFVKDFVWTRKNHYLIWRKNIKRRFCPATRICSVRNRFCLLIGVWLISRCSNVTRRGFLRCGNILMYYRSARRH